MKKICNSCLELDGQREAVVFITVSMLPFYQYHQFECFKFDNAASCGHETVGIRVKLEACV